LANLPIDARHGLGHAFEAGIGIFDDFQKRHRITVLAKIAILD